MPVTKLLVADTVLLYLFAMVTNGTAVFDATRRALAFGCPQWLVQPWTLVTYPLMTLGDPFSILFSCLMLWWFGGSLERAWSSRVYAWFFGIISVIIAVSLSIPSLLLRIPVDLSGVWMPLSAVTVAWAALNPEQEILLFFVLPVRAKYVGWATAAVVAGSYAWSPAYPRPYNLIFALFSLGGCVAAWRYVHLRSGYSRPRTSVVRINKYWLRRFNPLFHLKERQEEKRLRKLFGEDKNDRDRWR